MPLAVLSFPLLGRPAPPPLGFSSRVPLLPPPRPPCAPLVAAAFSPPGSFSLPPLPLSSSRCCTLSARSRRFPAVAVPCFFCRPSPGSSSARASLLGCSPALFPLSSPPAPRPSPAFFFPCGCCRRLCLSPPFSGFLLPPCSLPPSRSPLPLLSVSVLFLSLFLFVLSPSSLSPSVPPLPFLLPPSLPPPPPPVRRFAPGALFCPFSSSHAPPPSASFPLPFSPCSALSLFFPRLRFPPAPPCPLFPLPAFPLSLPFLPLFLGWTAFSSPPCSLAPSLGPAVRVFPSSALGFAPPCSRRPASSPPWPPCSCSCSFPLLCPFLSSLFAPCPCRLPRPPLPSPPAPAYSFARRWRPAPRRRPWPSPPPSRLFLSPRCFSFFRCFPSCVPLHLLPPGCGFSSLYLRWPAPPPRPPALLVLLGRVLSPFPPSSFPGAFFRFFGPAPQRLPVPVFSVCPVGLTFVVPCFHPRLSPFRFWPAALASPLFRGPGARVRPVFPASPAVFFSVCPLVRFVASVSPPPSLPCCACLLPRFPPLPLPPPPCSLLALSFGPRRPRLPLLFLFAGGLVWRFALAAPAGCPSRGRSPLPSSSLCRRSVARLALVLSSLRLSAFCLLLRPAFSACTCWPPFLLFCWCPPPFGSSFFPFFFPSLPCAPRLCLLVLWFSSVLCRPLSLSPRLPSPSFAFRALVSPSVSPFVFCSSLWSLLFFPWSPFVPLRLRFLPLLFSFPPSVRFAARPLPLPRLSPRPFLVAPSAVGGAFPLCFCLRVARSLFPRFGLPFLRPRSAPAYLFLWLPPFSLLSSLLLPRLFVCVCGFVPCLSSFSFVFVRRTAPLPSPLLFPFSLFLPALAPRTLFPPFPARFAFGLLLCPASPSAPFVFVSAPAPCLLVRFPPSFSVVFPSPLPPLVAGFALSSRFSLPRVRSPPFFRRAPRPLPPLFPPRPSPAPLSPLDVACPLS